MCEREPGRRLPDEADQRRVACERAVALGQQHRVARAPAARHLAHVGHEADAADHGRRRNRSPVRLVVERDVAGDDRNLEGLGRRGDAVDRPAELPPDLRLLRVAEVQAVRQRERLAARTRHVAGRVEDGLHAGGERIALAERRPVERDREAAPRWAQAEHRRVEAGPSHRAREDKLVVLLVDPLLRLGVDRVDGRGRTRRGEAVDLVAGTFVREKRGRDLADEDAVEERTQLTGVRDLADRRAVELPAVEHRLDLAEPFGPDDRDHPLLALGDHDLPRLHLVLPQWDAIEVDVDAGLVARHLGERGGEPGGAAVLQRLDQAGLDELERGVDQLLAGERVADLNRRALLGSAFAELLAREHRGTADPVAPRRRAVEDEDVAGAASLRSRHPLGGEEADAHRVHETIAGVGGVEDRLAADGRNAYAVPVVPDTRNRPLERPVRRAETQPVEQGHRTGPHRDDVAQDPADPGRRALEGLDRTRVVVRLDLERDRLALAEVDDAGVLARPLEHAPAGARQPLQERRGMLVAAMLRPEEGEDRELEVVRVTLEQLTDAGVLGVGKTERLMERLFRDPRQRAESSRLAGRVQGP